MKRYPHSAIILLAALALTGCSKTEEFEHNPDNALQIESVSGISPFALMQEPASKAVITGETLPGDEASKGIGLFVTAQGGGAYDGKTTGYSNVKYAYSNSKWSAASPIYLSNTTGKLYGYFPYSADATDLTVIPVESSLDGTDYLYATSQDVSFSNKSVNLQMNHALARLHLTIKKGEKYLSNCNLSKIVLQSKAIDASGTMDITTGVITATKAADATGTFTLTDTDAVTASGITKDILLVPASAAEGKKDLTLTLTIDGVDAEVKFTSDKGLDIRSGIQCNATLTIENTGIKVTGVGVGTWGDGGEQTVTVSGYSVTVKFSSNTKDAGIAEDVMATVYEDNDNVIIKANSFQDKWLVCTVGGNAQCVRTIANNKFTFTISEISSNIEAVLAYAPAAMITVTSDSNGKVWIGDDESKDSGQFQAGQQVVIHAAPNDKFRLFRWNDDNRETSRTIIARDEDTEYSANFISTDLIPGLFTVNASGKQVFFSKGNLWCSTDSNNPQASDFHFETNQYNTTPSSNGDRVPDHISHFMWCNSAEKAVALEYDEVWYGEAPFFAANNFTVNGFSGWSVLTGGDGGEWEYLLDKRKTTYGTGVLSADNHRCALVMVNNMPGLLIFPDDFSWPSEAGNEPQAFNSSSEQLDNVHYSVAEFTVLQDKGCVFLPAAGHRNDNAIVERVGNDGNYWSSTPSKDYNTYAFRMGFVRVGIQTTNYGSRAEACSVRLVTDVK